MKHQTAHTAEKAPYTPNQNGGREQRGKSGATFAEILAQADAVRDEVWLSKEANRSIASHTTVAGSIQSALAAVMEPVPWIGMRFREGRIRRTS